MKREIEPTENININLTYGEICIDNIISIIIIILF